MSGFPDSPCEACPVAKAGLPLPCRAQRFRQARFCERVAEGDERYIARLLGKEPQPDPEATTGPPGLAIRAVGLAKAIIEHALDGFPNVDEATAESRLAICRTCEFMGQFGPVMTCQKCGCVMNIKVWMPSQQCPIGRW